MGPNNAIDNTYLGKTVNTRPVVLSRESGNLQTVGYAAPRRVRHALAGGGGGTSDVITPNMPVKAGMEYIAHPPMMMGTYLRRL